MVKVLQFDKEEIVTNEGPLETLNLEQNAEEVIPIINPITLDKLVMGYGDYNFAGGGTWHITHSCPNPLSLLLGNARSQISRDRLPFIYEFLAKCGEGLEI